ncbi:phytanoyl-CoA dioxygenase family protein [Spirillospora sp. CA-255316]
MKDESVVQAKPCRAVTTEEVDHFHEFGWVKLKRFVDPDVLRAMLLIAREKMGDDADSNPLPPGLDAALAEEKAGLSYFNAQRSSGLSHPVMRSLIHDVGKSAQRLQRRATADGAGLGVRYYSDFFVPKLPASKKSRHGGNGPTAFHQDFITFAVDRSGGMTFWFPLEPYGPEAGTMSFVNGSHRAGVLGDYTTYGGGDALDVFPELRELEMSEPMTYELGDITVHTHLTIHGAGPNTMDRPRWAYLLVTQPADVCWNGSPCPNFDSTAMKPWEPFGDERFPVIS